MYRQATGDEWVWATASLSLASVPATWQHQSHQDWESKKVLTDKQALQGKSEQSEQSVCISRRTSKQVASTPLGQGYSKV